MKYTDVYRMIKQAQDAKLTSPYNVNSTAFTAPQWAEDVPKGNPTYAGSPRRYGDNTYSVTPWTIPAKAKAPEDLKNRVNNTNVGNNWYVDKFGGWLNRLVGLEPDPWQPGELAGGQLKYHPRDVNEIDKYEKRGLLRRWKEKDRPIPYKPTYTETMLWEDQDRHEGKLPSIPQRPTTNPPPVNRLPDKGLMARARNEAHSPKYDSLYFRGWTEDQVMNYIIDHYYHPALREATGRKNIVTTPLTSAERKKFDDLMIKRYLLDFQNLPNMRGINQMSNADYNAVSDYIRQGLANVDEAADQNNIQSANKGGNKIVLLPKGFENNPEVLNYLLRYAKGSL